MNMYSDKTDSELVVILQQESLLTFESQLKLRDELNTRAIATDTTALENSIARKLSEINNLDYLKDFGFTAERNSDELTITRTNKALFTDIIGIVIGILVFLLGIYGCINLVMTFINGDELDVFTLAYKFAMASLVFIGFTFFSGLKRLFDYTGFELTKQGERITLKKRFDVKLEEINAAVSDVYLDTEEDTLYLKLGQHTIFTSNADNLIQSMTLKKLANELKGI
ncbi:hypothetical protein Q2T41_06410 [Maribacter confluentis]|uniref:DUF304 domain-containing protein n=1 Tax=Maribacter confluentis TaxID=1656093 RepID=A0ABT8RMZ1_9FLAO|nr:hypothetical protein [Maribacter confluentis]MDO1512285.1 hypothetical protein [Maribacter confluentis]